jgi:hypothetical protein
MKLALITALAVAHVALGTVSIALAQTALTNCGGSGGDTILQLPGGASFKFNPGGCTNGHLPDFEVGGSTAGSGSSRSSNPPPVPVSPSTLPQPVDLTALDQAIRQSNATRCLTQQGGFARCAPALPGSAGRLNERSTRIEINWLVRQLGQDAFGDAAMPDIQLRANPDPGITGIPTWFWVDPASYGGQAFSYTVAMPVQWMEYWDTLEHHHDVNRGPCPDDPTLTCTTAHDWDELIHHQQEHTDHASVTVTFSPAQFAWAFGDDSQAPRSDSHAAFGDLRGMGKPYTDPYTPSPVAHNYRQSSLAFFDQGGFPIQLNVTWSASATWQFTSDLGDNESGSLTFGSRVGQYVVRHQVRESQPVLVASYP